MLDDPVVERVIKLFEGVDHKKQRLKVVDFERGIDDLMQIEISFFDGVGEGVRAFSVRRHQSAAKKFELALFTDQAKFDCEPE